MARVAQALGVDWHIANAVILARAEQVLNEAPDRFEGGGGARG